MMDWTLSIAILIGGLLFSMGIGLPVALGFLLMIGAVLIGISLLWSMRYNRRHGAEEETA